MHMVWLCLTSLPLEVDLLLYSSFAKDVMTAADSHLKTKAPEQLTQIVKPNVRVGRSRVMPGGSADARTTTRLTGFITTALLLISERSQLRLWGIVRAAESSNGYACGGAVEGLITGEVMRNAG
jgi:hypothetical protein